MTRSSLENTSECRRVSMKRQYFTFKLVHRQSWDIFRMATNWDIFRRANSDMGMGPYSRERTWQLRTWSTGCSAHCGLQCLYQLRPPFLGKTAASRAGLKKTFALQLRMNHGKRQRCSLYFSLCEKLKNQATSKVTSAHWRASIKWYIKPPGMLSWWHLSKQKFIDRLSTKVVIRNHPQTQKSTDVKKARDNKRPPSDRKLHQEPTHLWVYPKLFVVSSGLIKRAAIC